MKEIIKKLEGLEEQVDFIASTVSKHDDWLKKHDERLEKITYVVIDHTERLGRIEKNMATRHDIDRMTNTLDRIVQLTEKKDQELTIITHDMKNYDNRLENVENDIRKMKPILGLN